MTSGGGDWPIVSAFFERDKRLCCVGASKEASSKMMTLGAYISFGCIQAKQQIVIQFDL